jgi:hypothetical protein
MTDGRDPVEIVIEQMVYDASSGVQAALKKHTGYLFDEGEHERTCEFLYGLFARYRAVLKIRAKREARRKATVLSEEE